MPDIPEEAVRAAAEAMRSRYVERFREPIKPVEQFDQDVRYLIEAAAPILVERVRREYEDLLGSIWLYIGWEYLTRQLTTPQKELFADAVEASDHRRCAEDCDGSITVDRWWRNDSPARQMGEARA